MKFLKTAESNLLTAIVVFTISVLGFAASSYLLTSEFIHIPLGFLFSGGVIGSLYLFSHFLLKKDNEDAKATWSIIAISARFAIIIAAMIIIALMYYRWNLPYFNLFVFIGVYTAGVITFVISYLTSGRKE